MFSSRILNQFKRRDKTNDKLRDCSLHNTAPSTYADMNAFKATMHDESKDESAVNYLDTSVSTARGSLENQVHQSGETVDGMLDISEETRAFYFDLFDFEESFMEALKPIPITPLAPLALIEPFKTTTPLTTSHPTWKLRITSTLKRITPHYKKTPPLSSIFNTLISAESESNESKGLVESKEPAESLEPENSLRLPEKHSNSSTRINSSSDSLPTPHNKQYTAPSKQAPLAVSEHSYETVQLIGKGDVGRVYLVTGKHFAMKVLSKQEMVTRGKVKRVLAEQAILRSANHPFIVTLHHTFQSHDSLYFILEFCKGGELFRVLQSLPGKCLNEPAARFYAAEVLLALEYMHLLGFLYRDLKPENILLHETGHIMLADFDLSKPLAFTAMPTTKGVKNSRDDIVKTNSFVGKTALRYVTQGTEEYIACEVIRGCGHSTPVDWWTLGILLYEMLYATTPFKAQTRNATFYNILNKPPYIPSTTSKPCASLIRGLLKKREEKRLGTRGGASEIKAHKFFRNVRWALLRNTVPPIVPKDGDVAVNFRAIEEDGKREEKNEGMDVGDVFAGFDSALVALTSASFIHANRKLNIYQPLHPADAPYLIWGAPQHHEAVVELTVPLIHACGQSVLQFLPTPMMFLQFSPEPFVLDTYCWKALLIYSKRYFYLRGFTPSLLLNAVHSQYEGPAQSLMPTLAGLFFRITLTPEHIHLQIKLLESTRRAGFHIKHITIAPEFTRSKFIYAMQHAQVESVELQSWFELPIDFPFGMKHLEMSAIESEDGEKLNAAARMLMSIYNLETLVVHLPSTSNHDEARMTFLSALKAHSQLSSLTLSGDDPELASFLLQSEFWPLSHLTLIPEYTFYQISWPVKSTPLKSIKIVTRGQDIQNSKNFYRFVDSLKMTCKITIELGKASWAVVSNLRQMEHLSLTATVTKASEITSFYSSHLTAYITTTASPMTEIVNMILIDKIDVLYLEIVELAVYTDLTKIFKAIERAPRITKMTLVMNVPFPSKKGLYQTYLALLSSLESLSQNQRTLSINGITIQDYANVIDVWNTDMGRSVFIGSNYQTKTIKSLLHECGLFELFKALKILNGVYVWQTYEVENDAVVAFVEKDEIFDMDI